MLKFYLNEVYNFLRLREKTNNNSSPFFDVKGWKNLAIFRLTTNRTDAEIIYFFFLLTIY